MEALLNGKGKMEWLFMVNNMENNSDEDMAKQLLDGEELGKRIMREYTDYHKLKVAIPYMMAVFIKASEDKKLTSDLFVEISNMYRVLLEQPTE